MYLLQKLYKLSKKITSFTEFKKLSEKQLLQTANKKHVLDT